jgi:hypothetical protein
MNEKATFSIELKSLEHLGNISLQSSRPGRVFFEGSLGEVTAVNYVNDSVLEVSGSQGVLCVGIKKSLLLEKLERENM